MNAMIENFRIVPAGHCGSGSMRNLLFHYCKLDLPEGVTLTADPETLIVSVTEAQLAATESDADGSADAAAEGDAEGEATEEAAAESE